ncbi:hypothetical protein MMC24_002582 [Lignoscripta atroalba]|nr:hypothetical protein [Lignoscripta atroalba]
MKPLPPLPPLHRSGRCRRRLDPRRDDPNARCILSRMRRMTLEGQTRTNSDTLHQRRSTISNPCLTLSVPQQRGTPASPMIWLEDEQMWLVADGRVLNDFPPTYPFPPDHEYAPPPYARSEPSPRPSESEYSPVRSQFMTLMEGPPEDGLSPLFQEAIHAFSMYDPTMPETPSIHQSDQDWRNDTSRRESWYSAMSGNGVLTDESSGAAREQEWETLAMRVIRPASAMR